VKPQRLAWALAALAAASAAGAWWSLGSQTARLARAERTACALPAQARSNSHPGMVWVPPGRFEMGDTVYAEEGPLQSVQVAGFWMDRTEVTNEAFAAFVQATGYVTVAERPVDTARHPGLPAEMQRPGAVVFTMPNEVHGRGDLTQWWRYTPGANWRHPGGPGSDIQGRATFPVVAVTIEDARAYARWKGHALPTEAEWEWAARAARTEPAPAHEQPRQANTWQGLFPVMNSGDDGFVGLAPVGCYEPNALGLHDLIGNVWELTADSWTPGHTPTPAPPDQVPEGLRNATGAQQVIKGGSFLCAPNYCMRYRAGSRQPQEADLGASHLGFRTILLSAGP
jgi:formylglycine-generating enzyme required for sulfatase activity